MITTTIPIEGTFDIAKGRSSMRAHIAVQRWPTVFGARVSAALTALGELIIAFGSDRVIIVKAEIIYGGTNDGVAFEVNLPLMNTDEPRLSQALARLERATDTLGMRDIANITQIATSVLVVEERTSVL
jgi:hypothetical protein